MEDRGIRRGDIFWIDQAQNRHVGPGAHVQKDSRPAIIVSNDQGNRSAPIYEVVYLTGAPKRDLPTHTTIRSARQVSTALCEQISTVGYEAVGDRIGKCTPEEMQRVDMCILISLGITIEQSTPSTGDYDSAKLREKLHAAEMEKERLTASLNLLHMMYNDLLDKMSQ